jgi:predicted MPP superfamily phosphohydrolase
MTGNRPDRLHGENPPSPSPEAGGGVTPASRHLTRRSFLAGSALAAGLAVYSSQIARHEISILTRTVQIANLPDAFHGYRVVQISDIHFDEFTEPTFLARVVEQVNTLHPDLLLLTGDFISYGPLPLSFAAQAVFTCADILAKLHCPQRFAVMGNHDTSVGVPTVIEALRRASIPTLYNSYVSIERDGARFWLSGVADPGSDHPDLYRAIPAHPEGAPIVLMAHAPDFADDVIVHPRGHLVDLMLSGHTHGGQVRLPILGPLVLPSWGRKYVEGLYRFGNLQLYVNRGIGTVGMPFRLNCPPEITVFTLESSRV